MIEKNSVAAGIYEMRRLLANRDLPVPREAQEAIGFLSMKKMVDWLVAPDGRFGRDSTGGRDALLVWLPNRRGLLSREQRARRPRRRNNRARKSHEREEVPAGTSYYARFHKRLGFGGLCLGRLGHAGLHLTR